MTAGLASSQRRLRILLSDGAGLTSRQVATQADAAGHTVDVASPTPIGLASFTRHVRHVHRVPAFGRDPEAWLDATLSVLQAEGHDVLVPTQEQVALLSRDARRVRALGVGLAVPAFESLLRVQDKVAQAETLEELGLPRPPTWVAGSRGQLLADAAPPVYLKAPIGTASVGVQFAPDRASLVREARRLEFESGIVVQAAVRGPLAMIQAIFDRGELLAWHVNLREREGASGGASIKRSISAPAIAEHLGALGDRLEWHGAIALDAILGPDGPFYIDINPRLVEPGNAWRAGVDLVDALLGVSLGRDVRPASPGRADVRTHQLLLGVLGAAQRAGRRRDVLRELGTALSHRGCYAGSSEELTPISGDPAAAVPVLAAVLATLVRPAWWQLFTGGAVSAYALTPAAWRRIAGASERGAPG